MNPKQIGIGILVLAIIALAVMQFGNVNKKSETATDTTNQITQSAMSTSPAVTAMEQSTSTKESAMTASTYKDGTYEGTGNYTSPAQQEEVDISITVKDGVVTGATFDGKATNETSIKMQGLFSEGFEEAVVGKSIDEINLTVVNGSSLTPKGFMDALEQIKAEAQV